MCIRDRLIGIHHLTVHPIRQKIVLAVLGDKPPQALSHIQHLKLGEQVHQPVPGRGTRKANDALCPGAVSYTHLTFTSSLRFTPVTLYLISMCENLLCFW